MAKHDPNLDRVFQALSDPTRRAMLTRLASGPLPVSDLARPTGFSLPTVMRHVQVLEEAHLVRSTKTGRTRTCESLPQTLAAASGWLADRAASWQAQTDRLEAYAIQLVKEKKR
ncbi:MAG: ArsR/SmtB family transcription factor [Paracoccaceae bacterium]